VFHVVCDAVFHHVVLLCRKTLQLTQRPRLLLIVLEDVWESLSGNVLPNFGKIFTPSRSHRSGHDSPSSDYLLQVQLFNRGLQVPQQMRARGWFTGRVHLFEY